MTAPPAARAASTYCIDGHVISAPAVTPGLYIVATPIGNLGDITLRALAVMAASDFILCEDTRVSARLLQRFQISTKLKPYHDHNAAKQRPGIVRDLSGGATIALISDAGTPLVSDPGYKLVAACLENDIAVDAVPGASACLTALTLSGLPSDRFAFCGFLPSRSAARRAEIAAWQHDQCTRIVYESPHRAAQTIADLAEILPGAQLAVCRELTKLHQQVMRGDPASVAEQVAAAAPLKGEITMVIAPGAPPAPQLDSDKLRRELRAALVNEPPSKAAGRIARAYNLRKKDLYDLALSLKEADDAST